MAINKKYIKDAKNSVISGFFWAIGVTLGFAFVSVIAIVLLAPVKKLPILGQFFADVVYETQVNLGKRSPEKLPSNNLMPQELQNSN